MASDCGIGTPQDYQGPCNGHFAPSDAGYGLWANVQAAPVTSAIVACGALIAVLFFAVFLSRAVGGFFSGSKQAQRERRRQGSSRKFSEEVDEHLRKHPEALQRGDENDMDRAEDTELDAEDDRESEIDEQEWETDSPGARQKFQ